MSNTKTPKRKSAAGNYMKINSYLKKLKPSIAYIQFFWVFFPPHPRLPSFYNKLKPVLTPRMSPSHRGTFPLQSSYIPMGAENCGQAKLKKLRKLF